MKLLTHSTTKSVSPSTLPKALVVKSTQTVTGSTIWSRKEVSKVVPQNNAVDDTARFVGINVWNEKSQATGNSLGRSSAFGFLCFLGNLH